MYTDIHSHVIWGVDDGADTKEETFRMLREAAEDGISRIICTPHMTPGVYEFPEETFLAHFREAQEYITAEKLDIELLQGAEILYTAYTPRLLREKKLPTMAGTRFAMIEFSPPDSKAKIFDALQKIANVGVVPIIAHMERYMGIGKIDDVREIKERFMALVQINARSLIRKQPLMRRKYFDRLFSEGLVDFVATDTHAMSGRETCMTQGMKALKERFGEAAAARIADMPEHILNTK